MKTTLYKMIRNEYGGAMIWALLLVSVGSLTLPPLLSLATNGLNASQMYEEKTNQAYAADAGVGDGLWEIRYGNLEELFTIPEYDPYDYGMEWTYELSEQAHGHKINGYDVDVTIGNVWIPKDILPLNPGDAKAVVEDAKLVVTGDIPDASTYRITIDYYPDEGEDTSELIVEKLGVWLPVGFEYGGSNSLEDRCAVDDTLKYCDDSEPLIEPHLGGTAIVWSFSSTTTAIVDLPDVDPMDYPIEASLTFTFNSEIEGINPAAVSWIETSGVDDIELSWDADTKIYEITSVAGEATAQAHAAKTEIRKLGSEINGDYRAIGNSLMIDNGGSEKIRDLILTDSDAHVDDIPTDADVALAYLYWSGWAEGATPLIFEEVCHDKSDWKFGGD